MDYLPEYIKQTIEAGSNVIVSDSILPVYLEEFATIAKNRNTNLTIKCKNIIPQYVKNIALKGGNNVTFDFT